jgi:hypothetical protein
MPDRRRSTHLLGGQLYACDPGLPVDARISELATRQHGVVSRRQLLDLGLSARMLDHRLACGILRPLHAGVYAAGHEALPYRARVAAAVLAVTGETAASHYSALALRGLADPRPGPVHVTATQPRRRRPGIAIHRGGLPDDEVEITARIPVTTVPRTLLDLSGRSDRKTLRRLVKEAEFQGLVGIPDLVAVLERHPRRRGRKTLAEVVRAFAGAGRTRSELEDRFIELCATHHLPFPQTNVPLTVFGNRYEVDCLWPGAGVVLELDGWRAHGSRSAFHDDRARDRALTAAGYVPMRVTWSQLVNDGDAIAAEIRAALKRRT